MAEVFSSVVDSGERRQYQTGAQRDATHGKGRFDLVPFYSLFRLAVHYENGARKYGDNNWQKGMPLRQYLNSAARHLYKYLGGSRDEDHMAAVVWNIFSFIWTENEIREGRLPKELDDMGATDRPLVEKLEAPYSGAEGLLQSAIDVEGLREARRDVVGEMMVKGQDDLLRSLEKTPIESYLFGANE